MGKPGRGHARSSRAEYIGARKQTQGTETSKYLQEEKSIEIPSVAASERGRADDRCGSGTAWKGWRDRVIAPYTKTAFSENE